MACSNGSPLLVHFFDEIKQDDHVADNQANQICDSEERHESKRRSHDREASQRPYDAVRSGRETRQPQQRPERRQHPARGAARRHRGRQEIAGTEVRLAAGDGSVSGLTLFHHLIDGFRNSDLRNHVADLLGLDTTQYTSNQMTYDLRRLGLKGLIYRPTPCCPFRFAAP